MKQSKRNVRLSICVGLLLCSWRCDSQVSGKSVMLEALLNEMASMEEQTLCPVPSYTCRQESSYGRALVPPDSAGQFVSSDGFGIKWIGTIAGRIKRVMFDEAGPGATTRAWITTIDERGAWRFYFGGSDQPGWAIPVYDPIRINVPGLGKRMLQTHISYTPGDKGGNTLFLPISYARGRRVTFEDEPGMNPTPKYYHINFRKYPEDTQVETFSEEVAERVAQKITEVDDRLPRPTAGHKGEMVRENEDLLSSDSLTIPLPTGGDTVHEVKFNIRVDNPEQYAQLIRELVFSTIFDGKQTVWVPLSDFSGGGTGAPKVDSWYLTSDRRGNISSHWLMPYHKSRVLKVLNLSSQPVDVEPEVNVAPLKWNRDWSLYLYASWRQENGIYIYDKPEEADQYAEWNPATLRGKSVYKDGLLSLYDHTPLRYGEGDERVWVDDNIFLSHFGIGTEDYYNSSWALVVSFYIPFEGAPRAGLESSYGYNTLYRTCYLGSIPLDKDFKFDIEMLGQEQGEVDYTTTICRYDDPETQAFEASGIEEARRQLLPAVEASIN